MSHKMSYYRVITENPVNAEGDYLIYSTRTCKLLVITSTCLEHLQQGDFEQIPASIFDKLLKYKLIVPAEENELLTTLSENVEEIEANTILHEIIQPSANCQLGCYYCGQQHTKHLLNEDVAKRLVERISKKCASGLYKHLNIAWFGGEPLMAFQQVRSLSHEFMRIAKENNMTYSAAMVSNGLSLKENIFVELGTQLNIKSVDVTLDGLAEYHDKHRYTKENRGSFDIIYNNLKSILTRPDFNELGCKITIRCNVDEKNFPGISDFITFIANDPIFRKVASFYFAGIYSWGGNNAHKQSLEKGTFAKREINWKLEMIEKGLPNTFKLPERKKSVCTAVKGDNAEMIDAYGNVFNCSEVSYSSFYENTPYVLGNLKLDTHAEYTNKPLEDWNETLKTDKFPCHKCRLMPVCGGQCPKKWYEDEPACPPFKFNIREKMELIYLQSKTSGDEQQRQITAFKNRLAEQELLVAYK